MWNNTLLHSDLNQIYFVDKTSNLTKLKFVTIVLIQSLILMKVFIMQGAKNQVGEHKMILKSVADRISAMLAEYSQLGTPNLIMIHLFRSDLLGLSI